MISTTLEQVVMLANKWRDEQSSIRLVAYLKNFSVAVNCSVLTVSQENIGLSIPEQSLGVCDVKLTGFTCSFGEQDIPGSELNSGLEFAGGISIRTPEGDSIWLMEIGNAQTPR